MEFRFASEWLEAYLETPHCRDGTSAARLDQIRAHGSHWPIPSLLPESILHKANPGELVAVCVWRIVANGVFNLLITSTGTVVRSALSQPGDGSVGWPTKTTVDRTAESCAERSRHNVIGATSKIARHLNPTKIQTNRLRQRSPTSRARAMRKRPLMKNLVVIGRVVISASRHLLSHR